MSDIPTPEAPSVPPTPASSIQKKSNKKMFMVLGFIFAGVLCLIIIAVILLLMNNANQNPSKNIPPVSSPNSNEQNSGNSQTPQPVVGATDNKLYYVFKNNIYQYDVETKTTVQLTTYPLNPTSTPATDSSGKPIPSINIQGLRVIDADNIGFAKCGIITGDFGCGIEVENVTTKVVTEKKKLAADALILTLGFNTPDKYSYLVTTATRWQLYYQNGATSKKLEDLDLTAYGRGGYNEDSEEIRFSPDGNNMFEISTSSPRDVSDFNIYLYNLAAGTSKTIAKATQPQWWDNSTIIFRITKSANAANNGLAKYDISTAVQTKIVAIASTAYNPSLLPASNMIVYTDLKDNTIWTYNLVSAVTTKLTTNGITGFWVNSDKVVYTETELCPAGDDACAVLGGNYKDKSLDVFKLSTSAKTVLPVDVMTVSWPTSRYN